MKAMILAAGHGKRLRPLTDYVPKPLVPVLNVPMAVHTLAYLRTHGIRQVVINLHHDGGMVRKALGDGAQFDVEIEYSEEQLLMGTAGAIKKAEPLLRSDTFVVINSDVLTAAPLGEIVAFHRRQRALATLVLREDEQAEKYGALAMGPTGRIVRLRDLRVGREEPELVAMFTGIHVLDRRVLSAIPQGRPCNITEETYPALLRKAAPIYGYLDSGYWADIGSPARYLAAHQALLDGKMKLPKLACHAGPTAQMGAGVALSSLARLVPPTCVAERCRIEDGAQIGPRTTLGNRGHLERDSLVEESVLWENVTVGTGARIQHAIIAANAIVPSRACVSRMIVTPAGSTPLDAEQALEP